MIFGIDDEARRNNISLIDAPSGQRWTYRQLCEAVDHCRSVLASPRKALVFHFCGNTLASVAWYLGAIEAGHAIALLPQKPDHTLQSRLADIFQPDFTLSPEHAEPKRQTVGGAPEINPELTLLLSTSGSTGNPRFVRLTKQHIESNARSIVAALSLTANDRPIAHLPLHYSYGLSILNSHLTAGAAVVLTTASLISPDFWVAVAHHRVSSFSGVPYTYQMLRRLDLEKLGASSVTAMTQAGGKLDEKTLLHFGAMMAVRGGGFWVMYGQTEASPRITTLPAARLLEKLGSVGAALPGGSIAISTAKGLTTAPDIVGELVYRGPNVMWGYAENRDDLAAGDTLGGVLFTGDRARLDADGYVYILGRAARDAKVFGLRINMDDVEALLKQHGPVAVVGGSDCLIIYCEFGNRSSLQSLQTELAAKLRIHQSAFDLRRIDKLPVTASGKTDYAQLVTRSS